MSSYTSNHFFRKCRWGGLGRFLYYSKIFVKFGTNHRHCSPQPLLTSGHVCTAVAAALPDTSSSFSSSPLDAAGGIWEQAEPTPELLARLSPRGQRCPGPAHRITTVFVSQLCGHARGLHTGKDMAWALGTLLSECHNDKQL